MEMLIKQNWKWFIFYFLLYIGIYGPLCMRFGLGVEDTQMHGSSTVWLSNGRWLVHILRELFGHGPCQPASGLVSGALISIALILQTKTFQLSANWQRVLYGIIYLACMQWAFHLRYACMCDGVALSLLSCSASAFYISKASTKRNLLSACVYACLGVAGYQTGGLYLVSLIIMMVMHRIIKDEPWGSIRKLLFRAFAAVIVGLLLYQSINIIGKSFVPEEKLAKVLEYQNGMNDWSYIQGATLKQFVIWYVNFAIIIPLKNILGLGYDGQWVYSTSIIALISIVIRRYVHKNLISALALGALGAICIYLPESMTAVMPGWAAKTVRVKLAEPVVVAGMWALLLCHFTTVVCPKFKSCVYGVGVLLFLKSVFMGAMMARDEAFYFNAALNELRSMYTMACVEAKNNNMDEFDVIVCGHLNNPPWEQMFPVNRYGYYIDEPLPYLLFCDEWVRIYAKYARLPRMRAASEDEAVMYCEQLSTMPIWPHIRSVSRAGTNQVLIKIGN